MKLCATLPMTDVHILHGCVAFAQLEVGMHVLRVVKTG